MYTRNLCDFTNNFTPIYFNLKKKERDFLHVSQNQFSLSSYPSTYSRSLFILPFIRAHLCEWQFLPTVQEGRKLYYRHVASIIHWTHWVFSTFCEIISHSVVLKKFALQGFPWDWPDFLQRLHCYPDSSLLSSFRYIRELLLPELLKGILLSELVRPINTQVISIFFF